MTNPASGFLYWKTVRNEPGKKKNLQGSSTQRAGVALILHVATSRQRSIYRAARDEPGKQNAEKKILKWVRNGCRTYFTIHLECGDINEPTGIFTASSRRVHREFTARVTTNATYLLYNLQYEPEMIFYATKGRYEELQFMNRH